MSNPKYIIYMYIHTYIHKYIKCYTYLKSNPIYGMVVYRFILKYDSNSRRFAMMEISPPGNLWDIHVLYTPHSSEKAFYDLLYNITPQCPM